MFRRSDNNAINYGKAPIKQSRKRVRVAKKQVQVDSESVVEYIAYITISIIERRCLRSRSDLGRV